MISLLEDLEVQPLERAETLPSAWYVDPELAKLERNAIFDASWQYVGHISRLSEPGCQLLAEVAGEPILVVRGKDSVIRGFYNVCRHRGGPLATEDGCSSMLRCKYHGWTYTLEGQLRGVPDFDRVELFDKKDFGLIPVRVQEWEGLLFATISEPMIGLEEILAGVRERLHFGLRTLRFDRREEYEVKCNWKTYMDNYLEGYHVPIVHPELLKLYDFNKYTTETYGWYSLQHSPLDDGEALYSAAAIRPEAREALYYAIFPNLMLNILPGRLQTNFVLPQGPERCKVIFEYYYEDVESAAAKHRIEADQRFSHAVQLEDIEICELVQRGLRSRAYHRGRFSVTRENAVYHFQSLLRSRIKAYLNTHNDRGSAG